MRKTYISPAIKARKVQITSILAGSGNTVKYGGSNKEGGPTTAEGKSTYGFVGLDDEEE